MIAEPELARAVQSIAEQLVIEEVDEQHPAVQKMISAFASMWQLGPNVVPNVTWRSLSYEGRVVCVTGERRPVPGVVEVTDCYCERSRFGRVAVYCVMLGYRNLLDAGAIHEIRYFILAENRAMWKAVQEYFGDEPWAYFFRSRRKEQR